MKGYLENKKVSASQLSTWIKSKRSYIEQYIHDKPFVGNRYTDFGTKIHKLIEVNDVSMNHVPKLEYKEKYFEREFINIIINGYIDSYDDGVIYDYKTAKVGKWNQKEAEKSVQLKFYGLWHFLEYNSFPTVSIVHIETEEENYGLKLTGNVKKYDIKIEQKDIDYITLKIEEFVKWCEDYKLENKLI